MKNNKTYFRELPCALTDEEYETKAKGLADLCKDINLAKDKAKEEAKRNKEAIDEMEGTRSLLATIVRDKMEERSVECVDQYNFRERQVQSVRMDTGAVIATRAMEPVEYQEEMDLHGSPAENALPFPKTAEA